MITLQLLRRTVLALCLLLMAGCAQAVVSTPTPVTITIAGSTEMHPVLAELTAAYSERHPNVLWSIRGGGSLLGENWLENRQVDLAASTLFTPGQETPASRTRIPIGLDGIAVIVHTDNPVENLTLLQLRDIFSGRLLDWQSVGGEVSDILLVSREDGSATRMLFEERVMDVEGVSLTAVIMPTSMDVVAYVGEHPNAIGYVSRAYLMGQGDTQQVAPVHMLALEGRPPSVQEIATQSYYLTRPIFLVRRTSEAGRVQSFIDFVLSPVGQEIVARYHVRIR